MSVSMAREPLHSTTTAKNAEGKQYKHDAFACDTVDSQQTGGVAVKKNLAFSRQLGDTCRPQMLKHDAFTCDTDASQRMGGVETEKTLSLSRPPRVARPPQPTHKKKGSCPACLVNYPESAHLTDVNRYVSLKPQVECFLKKSNPLAAFYMREMQEALWFYDDYLPCNPVYILRLKHDVVLRLNITQKKVSPFSIATVVAVHVKPPDSDPVKLEIKQRRLSEVIEVLAWLRPSMMESGRMNVISPSFGLVPRKYVKLTVSVRVLLGEPFCREVDINHSIYCKIVHPNSQLCFHRFVGMFENQDKHDVNA